MRRAAFSLIEVIVVVVIVSVLVAITLPVLGAVRRTSLGLKCLANLRSCTGAIDSYTIDFGDRFPYFADSTSDPAFENGGYGMSFLWQSLHWPMVMDGRLGAVRFSDVRFCPADVILEEPADVIADSYPASYVYPGDYWLGEGFFTDPRLWRADADPLDPTLYHPVSVAQVTFPSQKGLLIELFPYHRLDPGMQIADRGRAYSLRTNLDASGRFHVSFVDGSVRSIDREALANGIDPGTNEPQPPVMTTRDGVHGLDLLVGH